MPALIQAVAASGQNVYVFIYNAVGQIWNGATFENYNEAHWSTYIISTIEQTGSGNYFASIPTLITTAGQYTWTAFVGPGNALDQALDKGSFIVPCPPASYVASLVTAAPTIIQAVTNTGKTAYVFVWNSLGQIWNGSSFITYSQANWSLYAIAAPENAGSGNYIAQVPAALTMAGTYSWTAYIQLGSSPASGDTPFDQGPFCVLASVESYIIPSGIAGLITTIRGLVDDAPDSKIVYGEMLGAGDTPMFPVNGTNQTFRLKKPILSDTAGAPQYTWITIVGHGAIVRSQTGFTIADQINGVISFTNAPDPGNGSYPVTPPTGVYVDYNWQYYTDAKYAQWIYQATQMTLAGTTDPTTLVSGLSDAMIQFVLYLAYSALSTRYAPQFSSSGGEAHTDAQTPAQAFRALAAAAYKNAVNLQTLYYQRQGQRNAPAWADINHNWDPISPIR